MNRTYKCNSNLRSGRPCGRRVRGFKTCWQHRPGAKRLSNKEEKFVDELSKPGPKTAKNAAISAGYSKKSARFIASQNLTKPHIIEALRKRQEAFKVLSDVEDKEIIGHALRQMHTTIADVLNDAGEFDYQKAVATGGVWNIREISPVFGPNGKRYFKVKMASPAEARRELAGYIGFNLNLKQFTDTLANYEKAAETIAKDLGTEFIHELQNLLQCSQNMPYLIRRELYRRWRIDKTELDGGDSIN